jgi:hypothetical protein
MKRRHLRINIIIKLGLLIFLACYCIPSVKRELVHDQVPAKPVDDVHMYLKVHMKDGGLYLLDQWFILDSTRILKAHGEYFDPGRKLRPVSVDSLITINLDEVALFETNKVKGLEGMVAGMTLIMAPTTIVTIICILDPKACFGSCPTFYAWNGSKMKLMAEGFSSSIAKVFEKSDVDMLYQAVTTGKEFRLQVTNEALETHLLKYADLLVFPRDEEERIFATHDMKYYKTNEIVHPSSCIAPEGDCFEKVLEMDQVERYSLADPSDLLRKETIDVTFTNVSDGKKGLVIGSRQSLMTTFLFYQAMAHAGSKMPYYFGQVENGNKYLKNRLSRIWDLLGGIEILVQNEAGEWEKAGTVDEMGPIAADLHLVPLPGISSDKTRIRIRMTRGLWRLDYLALAGMDEQVYPEKISPALVLKDSLVDEKAKKLLLDSAQYLVTFPGDRYELVYELPDTGEKYEVFLKTRGYYIEWMRENWIEKEDPLKLAIMFTFPRQYMKMMAPEFKKIEPFMEEAFWGSRYVQN